MPIYEYKCDACGSEFEARQGMDDEPLSQCRECSGTVQRLISFTSFSLKGGGWYSDGYAGGKTEKKNGAQPKSNGKNGNGSKGTSEKKETPSSSGCATKTIGKSDKS
jgi:putative FmdB family regulatory protein